VDDRETKHFYSFVTSPYQYNYNHVESDEYRTLGDVTTSTELNDDPYPAHMETQVFRNGDEYMIYNKNTKGVGLVTVSEDEKCPM
jgi:hypothetical protein